MEIERKKKRCIYHLELKPINGKIEMALLTAAAKKDDCSFNWREEH